MDIQKALGNAIKTVRRSKGFTQEHFSDVSSRTYVSVLENGKKKPSVELIETLALAMEVHPLTILTLAYLQKDSTINLEKLQELVRSDLLEIESRNKGMV